MPYLPYTFEFNRSSYPYLKDSEMTAVCDMSKYISFLDQICKYNQTKELCPHQKRIVFFKWRQDWSSLVRVANSSCSLVKMLGVINDMKRFKTVKMWGCGHGSSEYQNSGFIYEVDLLSFKRSQAESHRW